jgi:hypothetical protein
MMASVQSQPGKRMWRLTARPEGEKRARVKDLDEEGDEVVVDVVFENSFDGSNDEEPEVVEDEEAELMIVEESESTVEEAGDEEQVVAEPDIDLTINSSDESDEAEDEDGEGKQERGWAAARHKNPTLPAGWIYREVGWSCSPALECRRWRVAGWWGATSASSSSPRPAASPPAAASPSST